ncbi:MAG: hypothetical protein ACRYG8_17710 [Janthinobacterium lividum]
MPALIAKHEAEVSGWRCQVMPEKALRDLVRLPAPVPPDAPLGIAGLRSFAGALNDRRQERIANKHKNTVADLVGVCT